jgi:hypothetical protein
MREGIGFEHLKNGLEYTGHWSNDEKHGKGSLRFPDGRVIETTWEHNKMHGAGAIIMSDGRRIPATYVYDLEIRLNEQNPDCYNYFFVNLIFVLITIACWFPY